MRIRAAVAIMAVDVIGSSARIRTPIHAQHALNAAMSSTNGTIDRARVP